MKKFSSWGLGLPVYAILPLCWSILWNNLVYLGARMLTLHRVHYDMTTWFDRQIPVLPWTTIIYFGCYLFWAVNYFLASSIDKKHMYRFLWSDVTAKLVCLVIFVVIPTTNIRPEITGTDMGSALLRLLYQVDRADNLFPSIHCLVSWLSYVGIRGQKRIPIAYRIFSLIMALAVFISTLTTRQHVVADVVAGVLIAEGCYYLACHSDLTRRYEYSFEKINQYAAGLLKR